MWIAGGYVAQCLALQSTTAAKGALLAALQVVVVPVAVAAFPGLVAATADEDDADSPAATARRTKEWACAAFALVGVALLEVEGLSPPVLGDAVAALQPVFFGLSYLRIAAATKRFPRGGKRARSRPTSKALLSPSFATRFG